MLIVTPIYMALAALFYIYLTMRVVGARVSTKVALGHGGDRSLIKRNRAHGNFAEYAPLTLLMMMAAELLGTPGFVLHLLGLSFLAARILHAYAITRPEEPLRFRQISMAVTLASHRHLEPNRTDPAFLLTIRFRK